MAEDELMFTMEEVGNVPKAGRQQKTISFTDSHASDDEDEDYYICPITDDPISPTKEICDYLKNLVHNKQLSNSLPKNAFAYRSQKETKSEVREVRFGSLTETGRATWKNAIEKARAMPDPWAEFHLEDVQTEPCIRYRYNAVTAEWAQDTVFIKMSGQPFGRGAMRECYRTVSRKRCGRAQA